MNHVSAGKFGEKLALDFLTNQKQHYCLKTNFRLSFGELDLITIDPEGTLVITEVKSSRTELEPGLWVTNKKQNQIHRLTKVLLKTLPYQFTSIRFDVITVNLNRKVVHYENAFVPATLNYF